MMIRRALIGACVVVAGLLAGPRMLLAVTMSPPATSVSFDVNLTVTVIGPTPTSTPTPVPTPPSGATPTPTPAGGGGTALPPAPDTAAALRGKAYGNAFLTILKNGQVAATAGADALGWFDVRLAGLQPGVYTFGVFAIDPAGQSSLTFSFTVNVVKGMTTVVSGIFISPTITLDRNDLAEGDAVVARGYAFPSSRVTVVFDEGRRAAETVQSDATGAWLLTRPIGDLGTGTHAVRARAQSADGAWSSLSETRMFRVGMPSVPPQASPPSGGGSAPRPTARSQACRGADLNRDSRVDLVDFSILLYAWQSRNPRNVCTDIRRDGLVDLADFSLMMFAWTD